MDVNEVHFTPRQRQVVELIAAGYSNIEIGRRLGVSARTAKAHCDVLRRKLDVLRRRQIPAAYRLVTGDDPLPALADLEQVVAGPGANGQTSDAPLDLDEALRAGVGAR